MKNRRSNPIKAQIAVTSGLVMLFALIYVCVGFLVDLLQAALDPRIRIH